MGSSFSLETLLEHYVANNDEGAMAELVARTRPRLLAAARRIWREEAEDAVQSAYLSLVRRRDAAIPVRAWLVTAVVRLAYRRRAQAQRQQVLVDRLGPRENGGEPIATAITREEAELLRHEVWKLPETYRDAVVLHYLQGLSIAETAALLELNASTLRTRLERGRRLLRGRVRILYPVLVAPWLVADGARAAIVGLGGIMKAKTSVAAVLLLLASVIAGSAWLATRDSGKVRRARAAPSVAASDSERALGSAASAEVAVNDAEGKVAEKQPPFAGGVVVDTSDAPIEGVSVFRRTCTKQLSPRIMPERIGDAFRVATPLARTDADGRFDLVSVPPGIYSLVFLRAGYAAREVLCAENATFDHSAGYTDWDVKSPGIEMRVVLDAGHTLSGVVTTSVGGPPHRATVRVQVYDGLSQKTTPDKQGRYALHALGRPRSAYAYAGGFEFDRRRDIGATEDFRLQPRTMMIDVIDAETQRLIPGAAGMIVRDGRFLGTLLAGGLGTTDVSGWDVPGRIYSLSSRLPQSLARKNKIASRVHVFAPGYLPWSSEVTWVPGEAPPFLRVPLTRGKGPPSIAGRVNGAPIANVEVQYAYMLGPGGKRPTLMSVETTEGRFSFSGLPAGKFILVAKAEGLPEVVREVKAPVQDIVLDLLPAATLAVATKVANTMIHVETGTGGRFWKKRTNAEGAATFDALAAGKYYVAAVIDGWDQSLRMGYPKTSVMLKSGETSRIEVEVPRRQAVTFRVRDETGVAFSGVVLSLTPRGGIGSGVGHKEWKHLKGVAKTNDDGRAQADLFPGTYEAELKFGTTTRIVAVEVPAKGTVDCLLPRGGITLKGTVRGAKTGRGLSKCRIYAYSQGERPKPLMDIRASQSGEFEISGLSEPMMILFRPMFAFVGTERVEYATGFLWLDGDRDEKLDIRLPLSNLPKPVKLDIQAQANARVSAYSWAGSCWIRVGSAKADESGHVTLEAYDAPRYKVVVGKKNVEVERKGDRIVINVN